MPSQLPGNLPPVGAPPGFVPGQSAPQLPPRPPMPGMPQDMQNMSPEQLQLEMQLIQILMQNPAFAQAVTQLRAQRMAGGAGAPAPGGAAPQGAVPGGFADFVNKGR